MSGRTDGVARQERSKYPIPSLEGKVGDLELRLRDLGTRLPISPDALADLIVGELYECVSSPSTGAPSECVKKAARAVVEDRMSHSQRKQIVGGVLGPDETWLGASKGVLRRIIEGEFHPNNSPGLWERIREESFSATDARNRANIADWYNRDLMYQEREGKKKRWRRGMD